MDFRASIFDWRRAAALALVFAGAVNVAGAESKSPDPNSGNPAPFLWKIESPGAKPSWLFGTIHLPRPELNQLVPVVDSALRQSDVVLTEIPMDPAEVLGLTPRMLLPSGKSLADVLPPDLLAEVKAEFKIAAPKMPFEPFERFRPWAVAMNLVLLPDQLAYPGQMAIDSVIFQRAAMAGKETGGIETADEQLGIFERLTPEEERTFLRDTVLQLREARKTGESPADTLARLYRAGDLAGLTGEIEKWSTVSTDPTLMKKFMTALLGDRNARMAERMEKKMRAQPQRSYFFAVGAGHLDGPSGLLVQLEKAGFTLSRVPAE